MDEMLYNKKRNLLDSNQNPNEKTLLIQEEIACVMIAQSQKYRNKHNIKYKVYITSAEHTQYEIHMLYAPMLGIKTIDK